MTEPTFSVIMAAYEAGRTIDSAIRSVLAQTREDFELIVVDDGSTDDTADRVRSYQSDERVRLVQQENRGLGAARAAAVDHARGRFISVLDSDDLFLPNYLAAHGEALEHADDSVGFAYSDAWVLDDATRRIRRLTAGGAVGAPVPPPADAEAFLIAMLRLNFVSALSTVRSSVLAEVGPWDRRFRSAEDYELWLRILAHGYRGVLVPSVELVIRNRAESLTKAAATMLESRRDVYRVVIENPAVSEAARAVAEQEYARYDAQLRRAVDTAPVARVRARARRVAGRVRRRLTAHRRYRPTPPEVAAVFPDLRAV